MKILIPSLTKRHQITVRFFAFGLILLGVFFPFRSHAQVVALEFGSKDTAYFMEAYPYALPFVGGKLQVSGIKLPFPFGVTIGTSYGDYNTLPEDLSMGVNGVAYGSIPTSSAGLFSTRAHITELKVDVWVLPFLNVFGVFGLSSTDADIAVEAPINYSTELESNSTFFGLGVASAIETRWLYVSGESSWIWDKNEFAATALPSYEGTFRIGPSFLIGNGHNKRLRVWAGGNYSAFLGSLSGSIPFFEVFPNSDEEIDALQIDVDFWYNSLSATEQAQLSDFYNELQNGLDGLATGSSDAKLDYEYQPRYVDSWTVVAGLQYAFSRRFQLTSEAQFLGDRTTGSISIGYRFGIQ